MLVGAARVVVLRFCVYAEKKRSALASPYAFGFVGIFPVISLFPLAARAAVPVFAVGQIVAAVPLCHAPRGSGGFRCKNERVDYYAPTAAAEIRRKEGESVPECRVFYYLVRIVGYKPGRAGENDSGNKRRYTYKYGCRNLDKGFHGSFELGVRNAVPVRLDFVRH